MRVIFDSGPLITACKFFVRGELIVDVILRSCSIIIPEAVKSETVDNAKGFPDALEIARRIKRGFIEVEKILPTTVSPILNGYVLGAGEREAILLYQQRGGMDYLVIDEHPAYIISDRLGIKKGILPDLVVELVRRKDLGKDSARMILQAIDSRYPIGTVRHSLITLERVGGE